MAEQIVLVSGASRGLGYCIAQKHLENGDIVHIIVRQETENVRRLAAAHPKCMVHVGDISNAALINPALSSIMKQAKRLDILYNVAAIFWEEDRKGLRDLDIDKIPDMINVNACGPLRVLKGLHTLITDNTRIVNLSSESGSVQNCEEVALYSYAMSKAALNMATKLYHNESGKQSKIIAVCPGWMHTDMGGSQADLDPAYSAEKIIYLAEHMDELESGALFFKYDGKKLPW